MKKSKRLCKGNTFPLLFYEICYQLTQKVNFLKSNAINI